MNSHLGLRMVEEAFAPAHGRQAAQRTGAPKPRQRRLDVAADDARRTLVFFVKSEWLFRRSSRVEFADAKAVVAAGAAEFVQEGR